MKQHPRSLFIPSACCVAWLAFGAAGCDASEPTDDELRSNDLDGEDPDDDDLAAGELEDVWVHEVLMRSIDGGPAEPMGGSCSFLGHDGEEGGGGGGGPDFGFEMKAADGEASYRYFVAPEGAVLDAITPDNGELAAEIDVDAASLLDGTVHSVTFESYDGATYEAFVWGASDCDDGAPLQPPTP